MKIGILTIHSAHNYGAMLQAYAMRTFLMEQGYEVSVIDYRPDFMDKPFRALDLHRVTRSKHPRNSIPAILNEVLLYRLRKNRRILFDSFFTTYICPEQSKPVKEIPSDFDAYVIGSDQVWNTDITLKYEDPYFAVFPFEKSEKKYISYAASIGKDSLTVAEQNEFKRRLVAFDFISVREESAQKLLQPLTAKKVHVVIDPTLLVEKKKWEEMASCRLVKERYVLVYQVAEHPHVLEMANSIANSIHAKVIQLVAWPNRRLSDFENFQGPKEFAELFKHAEYVLTTSFHGTALSLIFEKNFYAVRLNNGKDGRVASLLHAIGLSSRMVDLDAVVEPSVIDYLHPNQLLAQLKKESINFLNTALHG